MAFKAFVSYSHNTDQRLAALLQRGLQRLGRPWYRLRALRIFRDKTTLSATPALWTSIKAALDKCEFLILLASPDSAQSDWVRREIDYWLARRTPDSLILVLTQGEIYWDSKRQDFAWDRTSSLPRNLGGVFKHEPFCVDLRWSHEQESLSLGHPDFADAVATISGRLTGRAKDELIGEDLRQHRILKRLAWAASVLLTVLAVSATLAAYVAVRERDEGERQRRLAQAGRLASEARFELDTKHDRSLLLAATAATVTGGEASPIARRALLTAVLRNPNLDRYLPLADIQVLTKVNLEDSGRELLILGSGDGRVWRWDMTTESFIGEPLVHKHKPAEWFVSALGAAPREGWNPNLLLPDPVRQLVVRQGEGEPPTLLVVTEDGAITTWDLLEGGKTATWRQMSSDPMLGPIHYQLSPNASFAVPSNPTNYLSGDPTEVWDAEAWVRIAKLQKNYLTHRFSGDSSVLLAWDYPELDVYRLSAEGAKFISRLVVEGALSNYGVGTYLVVDHTGRFGGLVVNSYAPIPGLDRSLADIPDRAIIWDLQDPEGDPVQIPLADVGEIAGIQLTARPRYLVDANWSLYVSIYTADGQLFSATDRAPEPRASKELPITDGRKLHFVLPPDILNASQIKKRRAVVLDKSGRVTLWGYSRDPAKNTLSRPKEIREPESGDVRLVEDTYGLVRALLIVHSTHLELAALDESWRLRLESPTAGRPYPGSRTVMSPDGSLMAASLEVPGTSATASPTYAILAWTADNGRLVASMPRLVGEITGLAFTEDNQLLSIDRGGRLRRFEARTGRVMSDSVTSLSHIDPKKPGPFRKIEQLHYTRTPDDRSMLALVDSSSRIVLWNLNRNRATVSSTLRRPDGRNLVLGRIGKYVVWSRNGHIMAASQSSGGVTLMNGVTGETLGQLQAPAPKSAFFGTSNGPLSSSLLEVDGLALSAGGDLTALAHHSQASSEPGIRIRIWDTTSEWLIRELEHEKSNSVQQLGFDPQTDRLVVLDDTGRVLTWDLSIGSLVTAACAKAGRNLSCEEWWRYFGDETYQPICLSEPFPENCGDPDKRVK